MPDYAQLRHTMLECQVRTFDVTDKAVLAAMKEIPRERYVPEGDRELAYLDRNTVLSDGPDGVRVLLQPMVLARLLQELAIQSGARALDVASGLGYSATVLQTLGASVVALETQAYAEGLRANLGRTESGSAIEVVSGSLASGCPDRAPFDVILVNGAVEEQPSALLSQLAEGGRLACIRMAGGIGRAMLYVRAGNGTSSRRLFDAAAPVLPVFRSAPAFAF